MGKNSGMSAGLLSVGFLEALGLSDCCIAGTMHELAKKAVRLARNENGIRDRARMDCKRGTSGATHPEVKIFGGGDDQIRAWRRFLPLALDRARARGRALSSKCHVGTQTPSTNLASS